MTNQITSAEYHALILSPIESHGYAALPKAFIDKSCAIQAVSPGAEFHLNRSVCSALASEFDLSASLLNLPTRFEKLYEVQLQRIQNMATQESDVHFSLDNDVFRKDLAVLLHRLIPCGAEFATPYSGVPRGLMLRGGWRQGIQFLKAVGAMGGREPLLELHMHPEVLEQFNPEGWLATYENLADLLTLNSQLRGVQSTSWFLDPHLSEISPHLLYLREVPESSGAYVLFNRVDDDNTSGALETSNTRRSLRNLGAYSPTLYTRLWPRGKILERKWRDHVSDN